jgi:hypothetical protein
MKLIITLLGFLNGGFMLLDGIYVLINRKYIGPPEPGPWAQLFYALGIDVFKLGPLFIVFGVLWLLFLYAFWARQSWAYPFGLVVSVLTLWYFPVGTLISLITLILLLSAKTKLGL